MYVSSIDITDNQQQYLLNAESLENIIDVRGQHSVVKSCQIYKSKFKFQVRKNNINLYPVNS